MLKCAKLKEKKGGMLPFLFFFSIRNPKFLKQTAFFFWVFGKKADLSAPGVISNMFDGGISNILFPIGSCLEVP